MATLNEAIETVDLKALDASNQAAFDASMMAAQHKLEALKPLLETATYHLTGNSHIDAAWLWPWTETVDVVRRTFGTALQLMYEYPKYTYTQSAAAYNEWMADKYPEMNTEIKQRIKEGRWEVVGGMWVEPDLNMPDGESLVRQLLVGKRWYKQHYGVDVRIGWNPDSFGYNWQLPQIYKKSGVDYFVTQKMEWNDTNQLPFKLFWWESPDGSKVLAYFPHGYGNDDFQQTRLADDLVVAREHAPGLDEMMDLYGIGDHGGGPTRAVLDEGFHWTPGGVPGTEMENPATATNTVHPKMDFGLAQPFFSAVEKKVAPSSTEWDYNSIAKGYTPPTAVPGMVAIPTWKSELYFEYHRGVMTTQANHKRNMRESSEQILNAEKWASLAWLDGKSYPAAEITEDWKKVLFNQFHDLAAGSGIGVIYRDAQKDYDVVRWSTNEIKAGALESVAERIDTTRSRDSRRDHQSAGLGALGRCSRQGSGRSSDCGFSCRGGGRQANSPSRQRWIMKRASPILLVFVSDVPARIRSSAGDAEEARRLFKEPAPAISRWQSRLSTGKLRVKVNVRDGLHHEHSGCGSSFRWTPESAATSCRLLRTHLKTTMHGILIRGRWIRP